MENHNYLFDSVDKMVNYLLFLNKDITPLRLQKTLYFLYAYYGATYGQLSVEEEEGIMEEGNSFWTRLFPVEFEAWKFGPVVDEVYHKFKEKNLHYEEEDWIPNCEKEEMVKTFSDNLINQLNEVGDFELVERSHLDLAWKEANKKDCRHSKLNDELIIKDYVENYV